MAIIRNTGSGSWLSASTWNTGTIPSAADQVDIGSSDGPRTSVVELDGTGVASNLEVFDKLDLVNATLNVGPLSKANGIVIVNGGKIDLDASSQLTANKLDI